MYTPSLEMKTTTLWKKGPSEFLGKFNILLFSFSPESFFSYAFILLSLLLPPSDPCSWHGWFHGADPGSFNLLVCGASLLPGLPHLEFCPLDYNQMQQKEDLAPVKLVRPPGKITGATTHSPQFRCVINGKGKGSTLRLLQFLYPSLSLITNF